MKRAGNTYSIISMVFGIITIVTVIQIIPTAILLPMALIIPFFTAGMSILFGCLSRGQRRSFSAKAVLGVRLASITLGIYVCIVAFLGLAHWFNTDARAVINNYINNTLSSSGVTEIVLQEDDDWVTIYHKYYSTQD